MLTPTGRLAIFILVWMGLCGQRMLAADLTANDASTLQNAQAALDTGEFDKTVTLLTQLRAKYPDVGDIPRLLAHAYYEQGRFAEARQVALEAIAVGRLTPDVLACVARIDRERDDTVALMGAIRLLTVLDAGNRDWRMIYGELLTDTGTLDEAATTYRSLLAESPNDSRAALLLGNVLLQQRKLRDAASAFETAWRQIGRAHV